LVRLGHIVPTRTHRRHARRESTCRGTGQAVRLTATPAGVQQADPADIVLSFLIPDSDRINADVITSFCHYVHFFRSPQAAMPWLAEHRDSFLLSLPDAYALGRRINHALYDESLLRRTEVSANGFFPTISPRSVFVTFLSLKYCRVPPAARGGATRRISERRRGEARQKRRSSQLR